MVDLTNKDEFERWLKNQPREVCLVVSARSALRAFPVFMDHFKHLANGKIETHPLVLSVTQALALAYAAAKYPTKFPISTTKSDQFSASTFVQNLNASDYAAEATYSAYNYVSTADIKSAAYAVFNSSAAVANGAAVAAGAGLDAANIASSAMYVAAARDAEFINNGFSSDALANEPLWLEERFEWVLRIWRQLKTPLLEMNENWEVWIRWYDAILDGKPTPGGEELDIFRVTLNSEEDWWKGSAQVNALIKAKEEEIAFQELRKRSGDKIEDFHTEAWLLRGILRLLPLAVIDILVKREPVGTEFKLGLGLIFYRLSFLLQRIRLNLQVNDHYAFEDKELKNLVLLLDNQKLNISAQILRITQGYYRFLRKSRPKDGTNLLDSIVATVEMAAHDSTYIINKKHLVDRKKTIDSFVKSLSEEGDKEYLLLIKSALWPIEAPSSILSLWSELKLVLEDDQDWDVWTRWYDAILEGNPTPGGEDLDFFRSMACCRFSGHHPKLTQPFFQTQQG